MPLGLFKLCVAGGPVCRLAVCAAPWMQRVQSAPLSSSAANVQRASGAVAACGAVRAARPKRSVRFISLEAEALNNK